jgi:NADH:ubiquinone oxidoreductase subunit H
MISVGMAFVWLGVLMLALVVCALVERRVRLADVRGNGRWASARADWGFDAERPPVVSLVARGLAGMARLVRGGSSISNQSAARRSLGLIVSCIALLSGLALIPFAGTWGGGVNDRGLLAVDLQHGLIALVFLVLLMAFARVGVGLAERSPWSRIGSVRLASQMLGGVGLFLLVLAPLALGPDSFRLQDIVSFQQATFAPLFWLPESFEGETIDLSRAADVARALRWPRWNLFVQPLTAILFLPAVYSMTRRPWVGDAMTGSVGAAGFGLDSDPVSLYWHRLEVRLGEIFAAALFVSLFLGAGAIPFLPALEIVESIEPLVGFALPAFLVVVLSISVFFGKLVIVLMISASIRRSTANLRPDQQTRRVAFRLLPLAWANLLLVSAMTLLSEHVPGTLAKSLLGDG